MIDKNRTEKVKMKVFSQLYPGPRLWFRSSSCEQAHVRWRYFKYRKRQESSILLGKCVQSSDYHFPLKYKKDETV